jgi:hypothetical protein
MDDNNSISIEKPKSIEKCNNSIKKSELSNVAEVAAVVVDKRNEAVEVAAVDKRTVAAVDKENDKIINDIISDIKGRKDCSNTNKNLTIKIIDKIKNELTKEEIKKEIDIHLLKPLYNEINTNVLPILSSKLNNNLLPLVYNQIYEKIFPHYLTFIILLTVIIILLIVLLLFMISYK